MMSNSMLKVSSTGTAALSKSLAVPAGDVYKVLHVTLNIAATPTTSENFTITLNAGEGAIYDTLLYSLDLSTAGTTDLIWFPSEPLFLAGGDALDVAYTNSDGGNFGLQIAAMAV